MFHDHLISNVTEWKRNIRKDVETQRIIYVGVHDRRTGYAAHLNDISKGATLVNKKFYQAAFEIYRRRYNSETSKVIFLAVSDEPGWLKVKGVF